ncbi:type II toxin-antitoxin system HipA family toxin [Variovorax sp. J22G73]|uniref:type II toxin-antitoxin system HipA family toxin n=1 Tax=unclassified Variovorax TaxID=663243 RepID=UPI002575CE39|nr:MULTISPECIES: type II toxin-antitoxin system HipA family toxin [unclassified Variovorax]MDM0010551.1 type II toxin-antitoxin system HipA family toxin [Variovorax sp. J22R203]MDM0102867.1 type II toxin-antitoxin system HipA family toxin [Variovorax sp. J22G73]
MKLTNDLGAGELEVWLDSDLGAPQAVGMLAKDHGHIRFQYTDSWLADRQAFALGPDLPLSTQVFFAPSEGGVFGALRDICPDRWGQSILAQWEARQARDEQRSTRELRTWDLLCAVQDLARQGALRLRAPGEAQYLNEGTLPTSAPIDLHSLAGVAQNFDFHEALGNVASRDVLTTMRLRGASLGGARPKISYLDQELGEHWIAKLPMLTDKRDVGAWEFVAHRLAERAGIDVPQARLLPLGSVHRTFCVKRFDRTGETRRLYASAMTLLEKKRGESASYLELAQFLESQGRQHIGDDLTQLFRRVVFNVALGNRDDHLRNHGFLRERNAWRLAPAFDVNPNIDKASHVLSLDDSDNRPNLDTVLSTAAFYGLTEAKAGHVVWDVLDVVREWEQEAATLGISRPEFERPPPPSV